MSRDQLFYRFTMMLFILMLLYGAGTVLVIIVGEHPLAVKMLSGFSTMFSGFIGLGAGYLLGRKSSE